MRKKGITRDDGREHLGSQHSYQQAIAAGAEPRVAVRGSAPR